MVEYRTIRIPEMLVQAVMKTMKQNKELGYRSHSEFIIDAVRRRVEKIIMNMNNKQLTKTPQDLGNASVKNE